MKMELTSTGRNNTMLTFRQIYESRNYIGGEKLYEEIADIFERPMMPKKNMELLQMHTKETFAKYFHSFLDITEEEFEEIDMKKDRKEIYHKAKRGELKYIEYLFKKNKLLIFRMLWGGPRGTTGLLGDNKYHRRHRIEVEHHFEVWVNLVWELFVQNVLDIEGGYETSYSAEFDIKTKQGILEYFNPEKENLENNKGVDGLFRDTVFKKLRNLAVQFNSKYNKRRMDVNKNMETMADTKDRTIDNAINRVFANNFIRKWKKFAEDPYLQNEGTKSRETSNIVSFAHILYHSIWDPDISQKAISDILRISAGSVNTSLARAFRVMNGYGITEKDLDNFLELRVDGEPLNRRIANILRKNF